MELYLLRHGIAADRGVEGFLEDTHRPLTPEGIRKTRKVAQALETLKVEFDGVLTSPLVRAKQTADLVAEVLGIPETLHLCNALAPGGRPRVLVADLKRQFKSDSRVLLVGHEPNMSRFASLLISGNPDADVTLKKAGLCVLVTGELVAGRCASLDLLLPPRVMLRIAR